MPLQDITFRDVSLSAKTGADLANADRIIFERVRVRPQQGAPVKAAAVTNSQLELTP